MKCVMLSYIQRLAVLQYIPYTAERGNHPGFQHSWSGTLSSRSSGEESSGLWDVWGG